jgi:hypothetical protein
MRCEQNRKWSYLDRTGKPAIELTCTAAEDFSDGLAAVLKDRRIGFIDRSGAWAIPPRFAQGRRFREGFARVEFAADGAYDPTRRQDFGFVDRQGNRTPEGSYARAGEFSEGLAAVSVKGDDRWDYIDTRGKVQISKLESSNPGEFQDGLASIQVSDRKAGESLYGYIDTKGRTVWQPQV